MSKLSWMEGSQWTSRKCIRSMSCETTIESCIPCWDTRHRSMTPTLRFCTRTTIWLRSISLRRCLCTRVEITSTIRSLGYWNRKGGTRGWSACTDSTSRHRASCLSQKMRRLLMSSERLWGLMRLTKCTMRGSKETSERLKIKWLRSGYIWRITK